jgi:hypothetical protein
MNNKTFLVVVHIVFEKNKDILVRTLEQVNIAFDNGADGVILTTGESITPKIILECYEYVRSKFSNKFIGINFMCNSSMAAQLVPMNANALWIDRGLGSIDYYEDIINVKNILEKRQWKGLYFGGFCMKGNNTALFEDKNKFMEKKWNPEKYFDVCVTSGVSTGVSIDVENLKIVKSKSNNVPLALASGVNIKNIDNYMNYIDYFIIGTGVEKESQNEYIIQYYKEAGLPDPVMIGYLDKEKILNLAKKIQNK